MLVFKLVEHMNTLIPFSTVQLKFIAMPPLLDTVNLEISPVAIMGSLEVIYAVQQGALRLCATDVVLRQRLLKLKSTAKKASLQCPFLGKYHQN